MQENGSRIFLTDDYFFSMGGEALLVKKTHRLTTNSLGDGSSSFNPSVAQLNFSKQMF